MELDKKAMELMKTKSFQSVRNLIHESIPYAIYFEKGFKHCGWIAEVNGQFYGSKIKMETIPKAQMDDIIDYYLTVNLNAIETIDSLCKK